MSRKNSGALSFGVLSMLGHFAVAAALCYGVKKCMELRNDAVKKEAALRQAVDENAMRAAKKAAQAKIMAEAEALIAAYNAGPKAKG